MYSPRGRAAANCASTERGLTQAALAEAAGVTRQTILAIERGGYAPSVVLALHLARVLRKPFPSLFWLADAEGGVP